MSKSNNVTDFYTDVANAIREKRGTTAKIAPSDMATQIAAIPALQPTLNAPTVSLSSTTLTMTNPSTNGSFTPDYYIIRLTASGDNDQDIYVYDTASKDMSSYFKTAGKTYTMKALASKELFLNSSYSNSVTYTKPAATIYDVILSVYPTKTTATSGTDTTYINFDAATATSSSNVLTIKSNYATNKIVITSGSSTVGTITNTTTTLGGNATDIRIPGITLDTGDLTRIACSKSFLYVRSYTDRRLDPLEDDLGYDTIENSPVTILKENTIYSIPIRVGANW